MTLFSTFIPVLYADALSCCFLIMQLLNNTLSILSIFSEPILIAHEREVMTQFYHYNIFARAIFFKFRRFFRQMQSSPDSMKQFAIRTFLEDPSIPSPLRILDYSIKRCCQSRHRNSLSGVLSNRRCSIVMSRITVSLH